MKARHVWANGWPGNYCKRCGLDDFMESAICCPDCYVPCDNEEQARDPVIRLCKVHKEWSEISCVQTAIVARYSYYGLETLSLLYEAYRLAQAYMRGWMDATGDEFPDYTDVRYYLLTNAWDMPYENACQVAMYITGPTCGRVVLLLDGEPAYKQPFCPVL